MNKSRIILASASPRRKELLKYLNIDFEIIPATSEEHIKDSPISTVELLALQKAQEVSVNNTDAYVIGADTIVTIDNKILGKPKSREDAFNMLSMLSGRKHSVLTGVCVIKPNNWGYFLSHDVTDVYFSKLSDNDILSYIDSGEPFDKAGAYAIQGIAGALIQKIDGCVSNVIGLPLPLLKNMLIESGAIKSWLN